MRKTTKKIAKKSVKSTKKFVFVVDGDFFDVSTAGTEKQTLHDAKENVLEGFDGPVDAVVYELVPRFKLTQTEVTITKL
jgi:hypothetical protein